MPIVVNKLIDDPRLLLGIIELTGASVGEASAQLREECAQLARELAVPGAEFPERERIAVRQLLKLGGFSPTGRNRPAQELLFNDLTERSQSEDDSERGFRHINNVVDSNNFMSLKLQLPISIFDADKLEGELSVRIAQDGEGYVFNASGHYLDLKRCIICASGPAPGRACGSPIKDSMDSKVFEGASSILAVVYGTEELYDAASLGRALQAFAALLARETGGAILRAEVI